MKLIFCTPLTSTMLNGETIYTIRILCALHTLGFEIEVVMISFYAYDSLTSETNWFHCLRDLKAKEIKFTVLPAKPNGLFFQRRNLSYLSIYFL